MYFNYCPIAVEKASTCLCSHQLSTRTAASSCPARSCTLSGSLSLLIWQVQNNTASFKAAFCSCWMWLNHFHVTYSKAIFYVTYSIWISFSMNCLLLSFAHFSIVFVNSLHYLYWAPTMCQALFWTLGKQWWKGQTRCPGSWNLPSSGESQVMNKWTHETSLQCDGEENTSSWDKQ